MAIDHVLSFVRLYLYGECKLRERRKWDREATRLYSGWMSRNRQRERKRPGRS